MLIEIPLILAIGLIVCVIAHFAIPGAQLVDSVTTPLLGIAGAFLGSDGGQALGLYEIGEPVGWIGAVAGAVILLVIFREFKRGV